MSNEHWDRVGIRAIMLYSSFCSKPRLFFHHCLPRPILTWTAKETGSKTTKPFYLGKVNLRIKKEMVSRTYQHNFKISQQYFSVKNYLPESQMKLFFSGPGSCCYILAIKYQLEVPFRDCIYKLPAQNNHPCPEDEVLLS